MMKYGFIRGKYLSQIESFRISNGLEEDQLLVDLEEHNSLPDLLKKLGQGDELIIVSFENACNEVSELCSLIQICKENGVKLVSQDGLDLDHLGIEGEKLVKLIQRFAEVKSEEEKTKKMGRPQASYPKGFWEVYVAFRRKEINSKQAAGMLTQIKDSTDKDKGEKPIQSHTFYKLVREFEH